MDISILNTLICYSITQKFVQSQDKLLSFIAIGQENKIVIIQLDKYREVETISCELKDQENEKQKITSLQFSSEKDITIYFGTDKGKIGNLRLINDEPIVSKLDEQFENKITQIKTFNYLKNEYIMMSSYDTTIKQFNLQFQENQEKLQDQFKLQQMYELQGHKNAILWLDIYENKNEQKVQMISSETGPFIFLWQFYKNEWKILFKFWKKQFGNRVSFFDDGLIIWQLFKIPQLKILNYDGKNIIEQQHLKIPYQKNNDDIEETDSFPMLYNKKRNIIILKYYDKIYIINRNLKQNGIIKISETLIQCDSKLSMYTISEDGQYLYFFFVNNNNNNNNNINNNNNSSCIKCQKIQFE